MIPKNSLMMNAIVEPSAETRVTVDVNFHPINPATIKLIDYKSLSIMRISDMPVV
jgi:hypothetical protein